MSAFVEPLIMLGAYLLVAYFCYQMGRNKGYEKGWDARNAIAVEFEKIKHDHAPE